MVSPDSKPTEKTICEECSNEIKYNNLLFDFTIENVYLIPFSDINDGYITNSSLSVPFIKYKKIKSTNNEHLLFGITTINIFYTDSTKKRSQYLCEKSFHKYMNIPKNNFIENLQVTNKKIKAVQISSNIAKVTIILDFKINCNSK